MVCFIFLSSGVRSLYGSSWPCAAEGSPGDSLPKGLQDLGRTIQSADMAVKNCSR